MNNLIYRQGKMFKINEEQLPESSRTVHTINSLYQAMFKEFSGAYRNEKYKNCTNQQKMKLINDFAKDWLVDRKLL